MVACSWQSHDSFMIRSRSYGWSPRQPKVMCPVRPERNEKWQMKAYTHLEKGGAGNTIHVSFFFFYMISRCWMQRSMWNVVKRMHKEHWKRPKNSSLNKPWLFSSERVHLRCWSVSHSAVFKLPLFFSFSSFDRQAAKDPVSLWKQD